MVRVGCAMILSVAILSGCSTENGQPSEVNKPAAPVANDGQASRAPAASPAAVPLSASSSADDVPRSFPRATRMQPTVPGPDGLIKTVEEPDASFQMPGEITDVTIGGDGRFLILSLASLKKVGVFDVRAGKVLKYIDVESTDFSVAGGGTQFVVIIHSNLKLQSWKYDSLDRPHRENILGVEDGKQFATAVMGAASEGPLGVIFGYDSARRRDIADQYAREGYKEQKPPKPEWAFVELVDLATLKPLQYTLDMKKHFPAQYPLEPGQSHPPTDQRVSVSRDGKSFFMMGSSRGPSLEVLSYDNGALACTSPRPPAIHRGWLAFDGSTSFSAWSAQPQTGPRTDFQRVEGSGIIPTYPGPYWLSVNESPRDDSQATDITLFVTGCADAIASVRIRDPQGWRTPGTGRQRLGGTLWKRAFFNSREKRLILTSSDQHRILVKNLDAAEQVSRSAADIVQVVSQPPREFVSGKKFQYTIQSLSNRGGVSYQLEAGPAGMTVSPDGNCEWLPGYEVTSPQQVLVRVTDKVGTKVAHDFSLAPAELPVCVAPLASNASMDPKAASVVLRLPAPVDDLVVGACGRYLLAVLNAKRQIVVFDVKERRVVKVLPTDDDVKVAAGKTKFVVYSRKGALSRWGFDTFECEATEPVEINIHSMCMGCAADGLVLVSHRQGGECIGRMYDVNMLKPATTQFGDIAAGGWHMERAVSTVIGANTAASANGRAFASWGYRKYKVGLWVHVIRGERVMGFSRDESAGPVTPSPDGSTVYTVYGDRPARPEYQKPSRIGDKPEASGRVGLPAATGPFYLSWPVERGTSTDHGVTLHVQGDPSPIVSVRGVTPPPSIGGLDTDPLFSRRLLYVPDADAIISLSPANNAVFIHRFSLDEALAELEAGYLFVASAPPHEMRPFSALKYQVDARSSSGGLQYTLTSSPPGASISPTGLLKWSVPQKEDKYSFSIVVRDAAGKEVSHAFVISVNQMVDPPEIVGVRRPRKEIPLPAPIERLSVGGGGRYLVGVIPTLRKVAVIDVVGQNLLKLIPVDDDEIRLAAGATKFVVSMGQQGVLARYGFPDCEHELTTVVAAANKPVDLKMGCASEGPVYAARSRESRSPPAIFSLETLEVIGLKSDPTKDIKDLMGFSPDCAVSADGQFLVSGGVQARFSDNDLQVVGRNLGSSDRHDFGLPSADGRVVYGQDDIWLSGGDRIASQQSRRFRIPAAMGPLYVSFPIEILHTRHIPPTLHVQGESEPILSIEDTESPLLPINNDRRSYISLAAERFFLLPTLNAICTLNKSCDNLTIFHFNLDEELARSECDRIIMASTPPTSVEAGSDFEYQIEGKSKRGGVTYRLDSGPPGMTISPQGKVTWKAERSGSEADEVVIVSLADAAGQEAYHTFRVRVDPARLGSAGSSSIKPTVPESP